MRLGFDATALTEGGKGIARVQSEFLRTLAALRLAPDVTVFLPVRPDERLVPRVEGWSYRHVDVRPSIFWDLVGLPRAARRERLDIVLTTSDRAPLWGPPTVVYLFEHPRRRARRAREVGAPLRQRLIDALNSAIFPLAMRRARVVLAASKWTAAELGRLRDVRVVGAGVSAAFTQRVRRSSEAPYFLHVASDDPRDNSELVVDALAKLAESGARPGLVVAGKISARLPALRTRSEQLDVHSQITWAGFRSDDELAELYRDAVTYVDPSLYEGFGLQALESLACGTPVIASNRTSLPEVVGDAGVLLDPLDVDGFAAAMGRMLDDAAFLEELRGRTQAQAARFTWEQTVRASIAACESVSGV